MLAGLMACSAGLVQSQRKPLDEKLFAVTPSWSYELTATTTSAKQLSQDQMIEDIAYLQHALDEAWAWSSRATKDTVDSYRSRLREVPRDARSVRQMCELAAEPLRLSGIELTLDGQPCATPLGPTKAIGELDRVPSGRNYQLRIDGAADHAVGVLTIVRFVDPKDPGWAGFRDAMTQLATLDFVIVDVQHAEGDDPRAGFAVLAALGLEKYSESYLRPAVFRDGPLAQTARANHAQLVPNESPRDRTLWSSFATADDIKRIAHDLVPALARSTRALAPWFLVGPDCGRGCQLMLALARQQGVEMESGVGNRVSGDELGKIRLPHSGIVATFPTVAYGPDVLGGFGGPARTQSPPDHAHLSSPSSIRWGTSVPSRMRGARDHCPTARS
jgi:hypothetical protein